MTTWDEITNRSESEWRYWRNKNKSNTHYAWWEKLYPPNNASFIHPDWIVAYINENFDDADILSIEFFYHERFPTMIREVCMWLRSKAEAK